MVAASFCAIQTLHTNIKIFLSNNFNILKFLVAEKTVQNGSDSLSMKESEREREKRARWEEWMKKITWSGNFVIETICKFAFSFHHWFTLILNLTGKRCIWCSHFSRVIFFQTREYYTCLTVTKTAMKIIALVKSVEYMIIATCKDQVK